jgi:hypothetical protein
MKLQKLLVLSSTSLLIAALPIANYATPTFSSYPIEIAQNQVIASGNFRAGEKPTTGTAKIVEEGGNKYLELDSSFSTSDQGPDLHVLLDITAQPPQSYENLGKTINLGALQSFTGAQRYPIPDAIDISQIKSVVIWCRMANATFGYAPL